MQTGNYKLRARQVLSSNNRQATAVILIYALCAAALLATMLFLCLCFVLVIKYDGDLLFPKYAYCIIFLLGSIICFWFLNILKLLFHRWFILNDGSKSSFSLFKIFSLRSQIKIVYLNFAKLFYNMLFTAFFFLPGLAAGAFLYCKLNSVGMQKISFFVYLVFLSVLLLLGFYFSIVSAQRTAYFDDAFLLNPTLKSAELLKKALLISNGRCFELAELKLSFLSWFIICILVFPLLFVAPYYMQSIAEYKKQSLKNQALLY